MMARARLVALAGQAKRRMESRDKLVERKDGWRSLENLRLKSQ
jgi:hypothetical protein